MRKVDRCALPLMIPLKARMVGLHVDRPDAFGPNRITQAKGRGPLLRFRRPLICLLLAAVVFVPAGMGLAAAPAQTDQTPPPSRISPSFKEFRQLPGGLTIKVMEVLLQLSVVLVAAKLGGALAERIRVPGVLGELGAGMLVGPFALGSVIKVPVHGQWIPLFPLPVTDPLTKFVEWPVSDEFWYTAQLGSIVLLFLAGLHTNLKQFLRYAAPASLAAIGGVVVPFFLGAWAVALFSDYVWHQPLNWYAPKALFIGAIMVATSVGITARVLSDIRKLDSPEGVTVLGAAVIDDVLGILVLAIVGAIAQAKTAGIPVNLGGVLLISFKAIGFWIGLTALGLLLANRIERLLNGIRYSGARLALALALALLSSALAEMFGLAFIIGAYSIGLALSKTKIAHQLMEDLAPIGDFVVPVFFAAMGMLVDFKMMGQALGLGLVLCVLAILGKLLGAGLPPLLAGFNLLGGLRIGIGMLPRGEVALIMAGVGLAGGYINQPLFGVAILITLVTTVIAPLALVPAFQRGGSGLTRPRIPEKPEAPEEPPYTFAISMTPDLGRAFVALIVRRAQDEGYQTDYDEPERGIHLLRKGRQYLSIRRQNGDVSIHTLMRHRDQLDQMVLAAEKQIIAAMEDIRPPRASSA